MSRNKLVKEGHHEELQVREEEGSVRGVQGGGCVHQHHEEHPHWPGLDLENQLIIIVQYPLWPGSLHLSETVQGGTPGRWSRLNV